MDSRLVTDIEGAGGAVRIEAGEERLCEFRIEVGLESVNGEPQDHHRGCVLTLSINDESQVVLEVWENGGEDLSQKIILPCKITEGCI